MEFSVNQIAHLLNGDIDGDSDVKISNFAKIEEGSIGSISFLANLKYEHFIYNTAASAVIVSKDFVPKQKVSSTLIRVDEPYLALSSLMAYYQKVTKPVLIGISTSSQIHGSVKLGSQIFIGPFCVIESNVELADHVQIHPNTYIGSNVKIGSGTKIFAGAKILDDCVIGDSCTIHAGSVIGSDGFGFAPNAEGQYQDIPQLGNVIIGNNVSIGANSTIDRATMGSTIIGSGVKIDNLVQIGHNVEIGENTVIAAQTGVAGSTKIGKSCLIAGQVGFAGHIKIADGTKIGAQSGVGKNIDKPNLAFSGRPLLPLNEYLKQQVYLKNLGKNNKK